MKKLLVLLMIASPCFAQNVRKDDIAILVVKQTTSSGTITILQPINGAVITVGKGAASCNVTNTPSGSVGSCSPAATLCSSQTDTACVQSNPFNSDVNGNYGFWTLPGTYQAAISGIGVTGKVLTYDMSCDPTQPCTVTGTTTLNGGTLNGSYAGNPTFTGSTTLSGGALNGSYTGPTTFGGITASSVNDTGLTTGNCVQAAAGGLLTTTSGACGTSSGTVTVTGAPVANNLTKFSGATSITNTDLSGDATTSGASVVTVVKINGNSVPSGAATNQLLVGTGANTFGLTTVPNCADTTGQHLNYNNSTQTFTCGSTNVTRTATSSSICSTGSSSYSQCSTTITWNNSGFADANYVATCQGVSASGFPYIVGSSSQTSTTITIVISNGTASGAQVSSYNSISCIGVHN